MIVRRHLRSGNNGARAPALRKRHEHHLPGSDSRPMDITFRGACADWSTAASKEDAAPASDPAPDSLVDTAEKASDPQQGAFNEETGEINWDCPVSHALFLVVLDGRSPQCQLQLREMYMADLTLSASVEWQTGHVVKTSKRPSRASSTPKPSQREWTASKSSRTCRTVSENTPTSTARVSPIQAGSLNGY